MRLLAIIFSVTLASPAFAGGIFADGFSEPIAAGTSSATLWSDNILGGAISDDNALRVRIDAHVDGVVSGCNLQVKLNGVTVFSVDCGSYMEIVGDFEVWREGTTGGTSVGSVVIGGDWCPLPPSPLSGLAWASGQTLAVVGHASVNGALVVDRVGYQK